MKRRGQQVLSDFFLKKVKPGEDITPITNGRLSNIIQTVEAESPPSANTVEISDQTVEVESSPSSNTVQISDEINNNLPDCWKPLQFQDFQKKYDGLLLRNKKLGCNYCSQIDSTKTKGIHVSVEWKSCSIEASGKNKANQQASLRKKLNEHFSSKAHQVCVQQLKDRSEDVILKCFDKCNEKYVYMQNF